MTAPHALCILHRDAGDAGTPLTAPSLATDGGALPDPNTRPQRVELAIFRTDGVTTPFTMAGTNVLVYGYVPAATAYNLDDPDDDATTPARWSMTTTLRSAADDDNIVVPYQQMVDIPCDSTRAAITLVDSTDFTVEVLSPQPLTVTMRVVRNP